MSGLGGPGNEPELTWAQVTSSFAILSARDLIAMSGLERHQDIKTRVQWLTRDDQPLVLFFVSHRWQTLAHPDPQGRDLRALHDFLHRVCACVEAMLVGREARLQLVPSLQSEGTLQAEEVARRILGFGPFTEETASMPGPDARKAVEERFHLHRDDRPAFRAWLLQRIGVWLDYTCMPQKPLSPGDEPVFRKALGSLDSLVLSSTLIALRRPGDDYSARGWCASESFLGSRRSFARTLFIDADRMEKREQILIPARNAPQSGGAADEVMRESYELDLAAFEQACAEWLTFDGPMVHFVPPAPWAAYRDLQGSSFFATEFDPNPFRRALEAIRGIETWLIEHWLMSGQTQTVDLGRRISQELERVGLNSADPSDLPYLGMLLASHGWIETFRPLFREGLRRYVDMMSGQTSRSSAEGRTAVTLHSLPAEVRAVFREVSPASASAWNLRLSTGRGSDAHERAIVARVRQALAQRPPRFTLAG